MEVTIDVDEEIETDVDIDFSKFTAKEKAEIVKSVVEGKIHTFKNLSVYVSGEFSQDIDLEPCYNEGYY